MPRRRMQRRQRQGSRRQFRQFRLSRVVTLNSESVVQQRVSYNGVLSSTAGGVVNQVITFDISAYTDYSFLAGLWDEFRLIRGRVSYFSDQTATSTNANGVIIVCYDNDDSSNLTTLAQAMAYTKSKRFNTLQEGGTPVVFDFNRPRAGANTAVLWQDTTSTVYPGGLKHYSTGLTGVSLYFTFIVDLIIELRGRR